MSSGLSMNTGPYILAAETGHDKEDRVLTRRHCPSIACCSAFTCMLSWSDLEGIDYFDQLQGNGV